MMLEYSTYSVISPEGCAAILWKSAEKAAEAAEVMGITAKRLLKLGLIDQIISEPLGGAHRDIDSMVETVKASLIQALDRLVELDNPDPEHLLAARRARLMQYGHYTEQG